MPVESCGTKPFASFMHDEGEPGSFAVEGRAALVSGHYPESGIDLDVLSVGVRAAKHAAAADASLERIGVFASEGARELHAEILAVAAEVGTDNPDGSEGFGLGASVVL